jgi:hypothetical protein
MSRIIKALFNKSKVFPSLSGMRLFIKGDSIMAMAEKKPKQKITLEALQGEITKLAESIYQKRIASRKPGDSLSDWLQAEKETKKKYGL